MSKKFDIAIMNPPYSKTYDLIDIKITKKVCEASNEVISIFPLKLSGRAPLADDFYSSKKIKKINVVDCNEMFNAGSMTLINCGIHYIDGNEYDEIIINGESVKIDKDSRNEYMMNINLSQDEIKLLKKLKPLREKLFLENKTMVHSNEQFIYQENDGSRRRPEGTKCESQKSLSRVKKFIEDGTYTYCLYKGSFNHEYDEVQEIKNKDTSMLRGQICWLMNKENVRDNMRYWMESPLFDFWRRYYLQGKDVNRCNYRYMPALDFDKQQIEFKNFVDNLYEWTEEERAVLKKLNVHNSDKLK